MYNYFSSFNNCLIFSNSKITKVHCNFMITDIRTNQKSLIQTKKKTTWNYYHQKIDVNVDTLHKTTSRYLMMMDIQLKKIILSKQFVGFAIAHCCQLCKIFDPFLFCVVITPVFSISCSSIVNQVRSQVILTDL